MPNVSQWAFQIDIPTRFQIFEIFFPHKVWLLLHLNFDVDIKSIYYILHLHIFRWTICWVLNALAESQDVSSFWHFWQPKILLIMDLNSCARQMWRRRRLQCQVKLNFQYQFKLHIIILLIYKLAESDRANLANVNISNIFWNLMENAERRKVSQTGNKRKPSLVEF